MRICGIAIAAAIVTATAGCGPDPLADGVLTVATRNAATTLYQDKDGEFAGPEHDLVAAFAAAAGVAVQWQIHDALVDVLAAVDSGTADLAAAALSATPARRQRLRFGPVYRQVHEQVVCRRGAARPSAPGDLAGLRLAVSLGSSYEETLAGLQAQGTELVFQAPAESTERLLAQVWRRELDCTVADDNIVSVHRRYMPELEVAFTLAGPHELAWALPRGERRLQRRLRRWFNSPAGRDALAQVEHRYYAFIPEFDYVDVRAFVRRIRSHYPRYAGQFRDAGRRYELDPLLLAALGYQESRWDPAAVSPTGVRGLMMLTLRTAESVGVTDRLDPAQSITGAARYLAQLRKRLPDGIPEPDRTWQALAAYNIGMGHVRDAHALAQSLGRDPDRWSELRDVLPLLTEERYYRDLRHGYARGHVPVIYVQRVRDFQDILARRLERG